MLCDGIEVYCKVCAIYSVHAIDLSNRNIKFPAKISITPRMQCHSFAALRRFVFADRRKIA